jgi:hypothetical protein
MMEEILEKKSGKTEDKKCVKCGSQASRKKFEKDLCNVCHHFAPDNEKQFKDYSEEKINGQLLDTFRKYSITSGIRQKKGMLKKASKGELMSRAPFGYKTENGKLVPAENYREVEEIFEDFLNNTISLRQLSKKHNLSVNGLKKILKNYTYIGKIKFNNQIHEGSHQAILSTTLFNHVQNKLEHLKIK